MPRKSSRLLSLLPGVRWIPSDISPPETTPTTPPDKPKSRVTFFVRAHHPSSSSSTNPLKHSALLPRKSITSLGSEPDATGIDARTHGQGQSDFFAKLPLELRRMVYEFVVGSEVVHLTLGQKRRFGHFICEDDGRRRGGGGDDDKECSCRVLVGGKESEKLNRGALNMLTVCRRMYIETTPHLYNPHIFSLLHTTHLLLLPTRTPTPLLNHIRTLRLRWSIRALPYLRRGPASRLAYREDTENWERGWSIIANMQGLRDLYVVLSDPSPGGVWERSWLELEEELVGPVRGVVRPGVAVVVLPYRSCGVGWDMGGSRVVLRRPGGEGEEEESV
ncbi:hypothetical protein T440DRAFT_517137 [Plenodomus tracheiphilus IPT5]|uniref:DUF7730 domain-containing protein n=1 Tax=Plenodomus tracheiphilus IPT5 TaxID=1408161 RepID=A0A6A7BBY6_9PLEO|nr:hypothetical protein T440DRAFT_517137 [Plenodomus tracheiphilus IPT5]